MAQVHAAAASQIMRYVSLAKGRSPTTRYILKGAFPCCIPGCLRHHVTLPDPPSSVRCLTFPCRYVEMLENQQSQLVAGLHELYKRVQNGQGWAGSPLKETSHGGPLTHDILESLGALKQENHSESDRFEEDLSAMQQRLLSSGAGYMQRSNSTDSDSETDQSPIFEHMPSRLPEMTNPFASNRFPPTPPTISPYMRSASTSSAPGHLRFSPQSIAPQSAMNPALLQRSAWSQPLQQALGFDDNMDFINRFETMPYLEALSPQMFQQNMNACLPTRDWPEDTEEFSKYLNGAMAV